MHLKGRGRGPLPRTALFAILSMWCPALVVQGNALAQEAVNAGDASALDAGAPRDAANSSGCLIDANGGIDAVRLPCSIRYTRVPVDSADIATSIVIEGASTAGLPITVALLMKGQPRSGHDVIPSSSFVHARAMTRNARGVEWEAISNVQGTFNIKVTGAGAKRSDAGAYYELHGTLDAVLPFTNLQVWSPVSPVFLHVEF